MSAFSELTVIVPVPAGDETWTGLVPSLALLPAGCEILFAGPALSLSAPALIAAELAGPRQVRWVTTRAGLGPTLEEAVRQSSRAYIWVLFPDAQFDEDALIALAAGLDAHPQAIHYFDLKYARGSALRRGLSLSLIHI